MSIFLSYLNPQDPLFTGLRDMVRTCSEEKALATLESANLCFAERGISTSTAMIAKHAVLSEGSLFRYYPSK